MIFVYENAEGAEETVIKTNNIELLTGFRPATSRRSQCNGRDRGNASKLLQFYAIFLAFAPVAQLVEELNCNSTMTNCARSVLHRIANAR